MSTILIDDSKFTPCGYCRRCALHDDPGGCLEVSDYERELVEAGATAEQIWPNASQEQQGWFMQDTIDHIAAIAAYERS